jgi:hypothetical protein
MQLVPVETTEKEFYKSVTLYLENLLSGRVAYITLQQVVLLFCFKLARGGSS